MRSEKNPSCKFVNLAGHAWLVFMAGMTNAFIEIGSHKLRSMLSCLGILFGIGTLVIMLSLISGIDVFLKETVQRWVTKIWIVPGSKPTMDNALYQSKSPGIRLSDAQFLTDNCTLIKHVDRMLSVGMTFIIGSDYTDGMLVGIDERTLQVYHHDFLIETGTCLSDKMLGQGARYGIISAEMADSFVHKRQLTDKSRLIGTIIQCDNEAFQIAGIYSIKKEIGSEQFNNAFIIPLKTFQKYFAGSDPNPSYLMVHVKTADSLHTQAEIITAKLKLRHRGVEDVVYKIPDGAESITRMLDNIGIFMFMVALLSLIVGGLSIMNVTLSSLTERTREIGIRKALGASDIQIFMQFLIETTTLSMIGGMLGMGVGCIPLLFQNAIASATEGALRPTLLFHNVILIFIIICSIGVLFGLYPAIIATHKNTNEALHCE